MSRTSNESSGLVPGIIIGVITFCLFGMLTFFALPILGGLNGGLQSPTDRIAGGDFSQEVVEYRTSVSDAAKTAQAKAFDEEKVVSAMNGFKPAPATASSIPAPIAVEEEPAVEEVEEAATPAEEPKPAETEAKPKLEEAKPAAKKTAEDTPKKKREKKAKKPKAEEPK